MAHRVFITYARKNDVYVEQIRAALLGLERQGLVELWKDNRSLAPGEEWETTLWSSLEAADVVLAFLSNEYFGSSWCMTELDGLRRLLESKPYRKSDADMYDRLLAIQPDALRNAHRLLESHGGAPAADANPSTRVHELVLRLRELARL